MMTKTRMALVAAGSIVTGLLASANAQAPAQQNCAMRLDVVSQLAERYSEAPVAIGLTDSGQLLEIFASKTGETFTVVLTMPNGVTCLVTSGQEWQTSPHVASLGRAS